jgi:DNA-binding response OmpR family regulator
MLNILLVEDDLQLAKIIKRILESKNYKVDFVDNGNDAIGFIKSKDYDFYLIDINIPGINGLELVKIIRENKKDGYILMITASVEEYNFKKAYEYGCDDYIKKPFHATELEVRIEHLLTNRKKISFDEYEFIFETGDLFKNGEPVYLRKKEKKLLGLLLKNANLTVNNRMILKEVWDNEFRGKEPPIRQLVNELRKKFDKDYIKTVVGVGYRFEI